MTFSFSRSDRPELTHGIQSGDISFDSAVIWSRADRAARMSVELAATEAFLNPRRIPGPVVLENSDFTGKLLVTGLPPGEDVFYRVRFTGLDDDKATSAPQIGRLRTAPVKKRDITFVWTGDTVGQGWGINEAFGGLKGYGAMRASKPDFFINSGDCIYADGPLPSEVKLPDGALWKNLVTEAKSKVAETLGEFRGNFAYNLLDTHYKAFAAEVPMLVQWDDHETLNNWFPGRILDDPRYKTKSAALLSARANQAFREYMPLREFPDEPGRVYRKIAYGPLLDIFMIDMRSYRGDNTDGKETTPGAHTALLGAAQLAWLKRELASSKALWKVIASDMPLGLVVGDTYQGKNTVEAVANGDGPAQGRELELAELLSSLKRSKVKNIVWLTADVHYCAAHYYDPNKAQYQDFLPFHEFVAGPIHAGSFGPNKLDNTFGPQVLFQKAGSGGPAAGHQFFGEVKLTAATGELSVTLKDIAQRTLHTTRLAPK
jgi:alkaline phosphatase D